MKFSENHLITAHVSIRRFHFKNEKFPLFVKPKHWTTKILLRDDKLKKGMPWTRIFSTQFFKFVKVAIFCWKFFFTPSKVKHFFNNFSKSCEIRKEKKRTHGEGELTLSSTRTFSFSSEAS
jgi:hypothetical protein